MNVFLSILWLFGSDLICFYFYIWNNVYSCHESSRSNFPMSIVPVVSHQVSDSLHRIFVVPVVNHQVVTLLIVYLWMTSLATSPWKMLKSSQPWESVASEELNWYVLLGLPNLLDLPSIHWKVSIVRWWIFLIRPNWTKLRCVFICYTFVSSVTSWWFQLCYFVAHLLGSVATW